MYFVSTPISRVQAAAGAVGNTPLGVMYSQLPARYPAFGLVRFIDGAAAVEWHGHYTDTLPCLPWETCTGHWPDGTPTVVVREADGLRWHRCLRCDAWVPRERPSHPGQASVPTRDDITVPERGPMLRDRRVYRWGERTASPTTGLLPTRPASDRYDGHDRPRPADRPTRPI